MSSEVINLQTYYIKKIDIIDNLTTDDALKPLSAKQGKKLQDTKLNKSQGLENANKNIITDSNGNIIVGELNANTSSGDYEDLINLPKITLKVSNASIPNNGGFVGGTPSVANVVITFNDNVAIYEECLAVFSNPFQSSSSYSENNVQFKINDLSGYLYDTDGNQIKWGTFKKLKILLLHITYSSSTTKFVLLNPLLSTVATSGSYNDLSNKPTIPDVSGKEDSTNKSQSISNDTESTTKYPSVKAVEDYTSNLYATKAELSQAQIDPSSVDLSGYLTTSDASEIYVAKEYGKGLFSGSYNDLTNKPSIPTKTSDLTNDSNYLTQHQDISGKANSSDLATVATSGSYNDLENKPSIPSKVSDLTNDSGYLTQHQSLTDYIQKSNTTGLIKNDGTIDTNNYLTNHQSLANYYTKPEVDEINCGTFTDLQTLITNASSNDIIILDKDYKYNSSTDSSLANGISITKNLTIIGNGHVLDGNKDARILILSGGTSSANIIINIAELNFINGSIINNDGNDDGGAICAPRYNIINISNCNFYNNEAHSNGGAISCNSLSVIVNCAFYNNVSQQGGAIRCISSDTSVTIINCLFKNNSAGTDRNNNVLGDDIFAHTSSTMIIYNCNTSSDKLYSDNNSIINKPYLTDHQDISGKANSSDLADIATSGSYDDIDGVATEQLSITYDDNGTDVTETITFLVVEETGETDW